MGAIGGTILNPAILKSLRPNLHLPPAGARSFYRRGFLMLFSGVMYEGMVNSSLGPQSAKIERAIAS